MSAEFLGRAGKKFSKTADRTVRIASVASVALAPYTPVFSPQKEAESPKDQGHTLVVDTPLNLNGMPKTLEAPDGRKVIFGNTEREQVQSQEVSVFGVMAGFNQQGNILLSTIDGQRREITLPRVPLLVLGEAKFSPDGTKIAVWRQYRDGPPPVKHDTYLVASGTGEIAPFIPGFLENLGQFPTYRSFTWSPDGKKLAFAAGQHGGGKTIGVDMETEKVLFELRGSGFGEFSPDGQWFAKIDIERKSLEVVNVNGPGLIVPNNAEFFSWSPDSRYITFHKCLMWSEGGQGPHCNVSKLSVFDLERQESKDFEYSMSYVRPVFSPDGRKIAFRESDNTRIAKLSILDVNTGRRASVNFPSEEVPLNNDWSLRFYGNERLLAWGRKFRDPRTHLIWLDSGNASVISQQWLSQRGYSQVLLKEIVRDRIICEIQDNRGRTGWGITQIADRDGELAVTPLVYFSGISPIGTSEILGLVGEGERVVSGEQNFLFLGGRKRLIEHEEIVGYFGEQKSSMPEGLASFIPEGEKISFRPGDVVGDRDLGIWYLRNGKRYKVQNWDWFATRLRYRDWNEPRHRDAPAAWPTAAEIISWIPIGEVPEPSSGREGILDWDEREKKHQPYGGRMIVFMGGYNGSSAGQLDAFRDVKTTLLQRGWRESHFLEASYHIDQQLLRAEVILPRPYESAHTALHPSFHISHMSLQLQRYKEMFPLTKFVLIGHSLGGFTLVNAALDHADAIDTIITIDSPIKGIDRSFYALDRIIAFFGETVGSYLVGLGDNPATDQEVENNAHRLRCRGVRTFTFTNQYDRFIPPPVATLKDPYLDEECSGERAKMVWDLGIDWDDKIGHGKALYDPEVLDTIAMLIPPSEP